MVHLPRGRRWSASVSHYPHRTPTPMETEVNDPLPDTWNARDLPVLRKIVRQLDGGPSPSIGGEGSWADLSVVWRDLHERGGRGGTGVSPRTVEIARAVLRKALKDAVVERLLTVNPVVGSKMPKRAVKPKHSTWTGAQVQTFLDAVDGSRWAPMWQLAVATGMRRAELMALTWPHLDLDAGVVSVERSTTQLKTQRVTSTPKNHAGGSTSTPGRWPRSVPGASCRQRSG